MKSYLPATVFGFALTAAAFGFGAATAHAADSPEQTATQVEAAYVMQANADLPSGWLTPWTTPIH